jgi:ABC-type branched-subunit amino acid transport system substrate-binding protein
MLKKLGATAAAAGIVAVVVAATLGGTASARLNSLASLAATAKKCGKVVTIGVAYPQTGPVATLGGNQWDWAQAAEKAWNKTQKPKIKLVQGDTQLAGTTPQAVQVAHAFASNSAILAVTGPAGSQEVQDSDSIYQAAGMAAVSGSATRVALTRGLTGTPRETANGFFFRTVPNDGQQGDNVASYIHNVLKKTKVEIIDDEEAYSTGLAAQVKTDLQADGATVSTNHISQQDTDFSSVIDSIPGGTQVIYIPWQNATQAQQFYTQLHAHGGTEILFGSDGTDVPGTFKGTGSYVSGFPVDFSSTAVKTFSKAHGGDPETFGIPTYTSVIVNATAIKMACAAGKGKTTRTAVRKDIPKVHLSLAASLLGFPVQFLGKNAGKFQGPGDMGGKASFGIYQIQSNGTYKRVG